MSLLDWKRRKDNLNGNHPMRVGATSFFCHNFEVRDSHLALSFLELRFSLRQVIEFSSIASSLVVVTYLVGSRAPVVWQ